VDGDARFLSHHDVVRLMERAAARAQLPLTYSRGFNPRPKLSLPLPRPVGVASRCELMVIELDGEAEAELLAGRLRRQLPEGMTVLRADLLPPGRPPRVVSASYELELQEQERPRLEKRLEELARMETWEVTRRARPGHRRRGEKREIVDIKPGVGRLAPAGDRLSFALLSGPGSARCGELLALLELAGPGEAPAGGVPPAAEVLARLRRTQIQWEFEPARNEARTRQI
jgi:radical SAM-linked protein